MIYLRLLGQRKISWDDRRQFYVFAAHVMRNILKDHARAHLAERRGGRFAIRLPISEDIAWIAGSPEEILDLHRALETVKGGVKAGHCGVRTKSWTLWR